MFADTTTKSPETISANSLVDELVEVKVEPEGFHDSNVNILNGNKLTPNNSEPLKSFDKSSANSTGKFQCYLICFTLINTLM